MACTSEAVEALLQRSLSAQRQEHSRAVAELAQGLCRRFGVDPQKGRLAGLAHDLAREAGERQLRHLTLRDGAPISRLERERPVLLHGRAAAVLIREGLGIEDGEVLEAVALHVTGAPGMGLLAKIVFAADFLEPGRRFVDEVFRRTALALDIDPMLVMVMGYIFDYLRQEGRTIARPARELYRELGKR